MEDNCLDKRCKHLIIGEFILSFSKIGILEISANIPTSGMAFYHPEKNVSDFQFRIDTVESNSRKVLLFGSENFMFPAFLYQEDSGFYRWITWKQDNTPALAFRISPDWREFVLYNDQTDTCGEQAFHEFGSLFSYAVLNYHACVLHGVVMEYEGKGILVTAAAGTGKTTHTRMWRDHKNALIINGDRCLCRKIEGRWYAYGMPWAGSSGEYINRRVPISCIVNLRRGNVNSVHPMSVFDSYIYLMQRIFAPVWQGDLQNKGLNLCEELAKEIPVVEFFCRPDLDSVNVLEKAIQKYGY